MKTLAKAKLASSITFIVLASFMIVTYDRQNMFIIQATGYVLSCSAPFTVASFPFTEFCVYHSMSMNVITKSITMGLIQTGPESRFTKLLKKIFFLNFLVKLVFDN